MLDITVYINTLEESIHYVGYIRPMIKLIIIT